MLNEPLPGLDYTRVNEDAQILCRRQDFPRAVNVLQRRAPDHRRWRVALRGLAATASRNLGGARLGWVSGAVRELITAVPEPWLRGELALDLCTSAAAIAPADVLPVWTARALWRHADDVGLPMDYLTRVTTLPRSIDGAIDTARVILDCRQTASAHRELSLSLSATLAPRDADAPRSRAERLLESQVMAQKDAAARWRLLAHRLLVGTARG